MNPQSIKVLNESFLEIILLRDEVAELFYERLFALDPSLRGIFSEINIRDQGAKFVSTLIGIIARLDKPDQITRELVDLARRHVGYGVTEAHYATAGAALIQTMALIFGARFTADMRSAWTEAYSMISGTMMKADELDPMRTAGLKGTESTEPFLYESSISSFA